MLKKEIQKSLGKIPTQANLLLAITSPDFNPSGLLLQPPQFFFRELGIYSIFTFSFRQREGIRKIIASVTDHWVGRRALLLNNL